MANGTRDLYNIQYFDEYEKNEIMEIESALTPGNIFSSVEQN